MGILESLGFGAPQPDPMQAQQAPQPGLGSRINSGIADNSGMLIGLGTGLMAHRQDASNPIFNANALMVGQQMDEKRKKEREEKEKERRGRQAAMSLFKRLGVDETQAMDIVNSGYGEQFLKAHMDSLEPDKPTADIQNYKFYANEELKAGRTPKPFGEWSQSAGSGAGEFGLNPIYGEDAEGNPVLFQPSKRGGVQPIQFPEGVTPSTGIDKIDAETHWVIKDKRSGQTLGIVPKDIEGAAAAEVRGKGMGEAQMELGGTLAKTQMSIDTLDKIIEHPGRETGTGLSGLIDPRNYIRGTDAMNFHVLRNQAVGQVYLEAYQELKGGGHITEFEGKKAEQAKARLDTAQGDAEFLAAVQELREVLVAGAERARQKAGQSGGQTSSGWQQVAPNVRIRRLD